MKISVRTPETHETNANLIWELTKFSGDRLILSAGYLTAFDALPFNEMLFSVSSIDLVVGTWPKSDPVETAVALNRLQTKVDAFAARVAAEAADSGMHKLKLNVYLVQNWHAKVALMVSTDTAGKSIVSAAVIGSSNISAPALGMIMPGSNVETDILVSTSDGSDASGELNMILKYLEPTFLNNFYKSY